MGCCLSCLSCDCVECCQRCFTGSYLWRTKAQRVFFVNKVNNNVETRSSGWLIFTGSWLFYYLDVEGFREYYNAPYSYVNFDSNRSKAFAFPLAKVVTRCSYEKAVSDWRLTSNSLFTDFFAALTAVKQPTQAQTGYLVLDVFFNGGLFNGAGSIYVYMEEAEVLAGLINDVLSKGVNSVVAYTDGKDESEVGVGTTEHKRL